MARLNTHQSATPQTHVTRASTVDSLYREPSVLPSGPRESSYLGLSPALSQSSDKENELPVSRESTPRAATKSRRPMAASQARLPTPRTSDSSQPARKRPRTNDYDIDSSQIYLDDDRDGQVHQDEDEEEEQEQDGVNGDGTEDDDDDTRFYDPQQDPEMRKQLRAKIRNHHREMEDKRDELTAPGNDGIIKGMKRLNYYMGKVKQTDDATLDSRAFVYTVDLASKKQKNTLHGNNSVGIDVDQFVSRCIHFMRSGGDPIASDQRSTQARHRRRTQAAADEDEEDPEAGDGLDWALLGREACFPFNKRPPVPSFLLGPLSVQKRARAPVARRARSQKQPTGPATRPQELTQADIQQSENSNLTHLVKGIHTRLQRHIDESSRKVDEELNELENEADDEDVEAASRRHRVWQTPDEEAAVSLFDFVVNPRSFGQTVENMFYISFLIREGSVKVLEDGKGLPLLVPAEPHTIEEQRAKHVQKHQAVFSLDWPTWKKLIEAFDIKEPLIPHRVTEQTTVSAGGWYG